MHEAVASSSPWPLALLTWTGPVAICQGEFYENSWLSVPVFLDGELLLVSAEDRSIDN